MIRLTRIPTLFLNSWLRWRRRKIIIIIIIFSFEVLIDFFDLPSIIRATRIGIIVWEEFPTWCHSCGWWFRNGWTGLPWVVAAFWGLCLRCLFLLIVVVVATVACDSPSDTKWSSCCWTFPISVESLFLQLLIRRTSERWVRRFRNTSCWTSESCCTAIRLSLF